MNDDFETSLGTALRAHVDGVYPDVQSLVDSSVRTGARLQRRRRIGGIVGAAAAIGIIAGAAAALPGLGGAAPAEQPGFAAQPSTPPSASPSSSPTTLSEGQTLDLGDGLTGTVRADDPALFKGPRALYQMGSIALPGPGKGWVIVVSGPLPKLDAFWSGGFGDAGQQWKGATFALGHADADAMHAFGLVDKVPVTVTDSTWTCEWTLMDNKAACTADDGDVATLVIRESKDRAEWMASDDKGNNDATWTSETHGDIFISVQGNPGSDARMEQLGTSLVWKD